MLHSRAKNLLIIQDLEYHIEGLERFNFMISNIGFEKEIECGTG